MDEVFCMNSPIGPLSIREQDGALTEIRFCADDLVAPTTSLQREAARQLEAYFRGKLRVFDLPLRPSGTLFQMRVWRALLEIPYGETRCYGDIAERIGCARGMRAVGMANHRNPLPIVIPCHRVIGKNGSLTGYAGGLSIKEYLLALERGR